MKRLFKGENSLESIMAVLTVVASLGVLQTFLIGKHFVIPTLALLLMVLAGNLVRFGLQGQRWVKHLLFWLFFLVSAHAFFALFWAGSARPGEFLGAAFYPLYGGVFAGLGFLCWKYAKKNALFQ
jgi:hypothetical protein